MNLIRVKYIFAILLSLAVQQAYSQDYTPIQGSINEYTAITHVLSAQDWNSDSVVVTNTSNFGERDTVMVYCVKGATIGTAHDSTYLPGNNVYDPGIDAQNPRNTGKYAFFLVSEVIGDTVVLNASLNPEIMPMANGETAQLIRVRSYRYANVTGTGLSAPSWNPATGTGGVITLFVHGVLRLDADINVSADGFKGALGNTDAIYTAGCSSTDTINYYEPFYLNGELYAGLKGEGTTDTSFRYIRGKASGINGGGGGNGLSAGGGGGSNYSAGVRGGSESTACSPGVDITGGNGGFDLGRSGYYYVDFNPLNRGNRIFFGGGGGSGTRPAGATNTRGGNGGGIVVIVADTILGNGGGIYADGEDVSGTAVNGAAGGGGGGGCIILDVAGYQGTIPLSAVGGNGGNSSGSDTTGMGGAGGGGIYWHAGSVNPPELSPSFATGTNGVFESVIPYDPLESPNPPFRKDELIAPLRGFLFNPVPNEFWVCSDQDPDPIIASDPKGGDGTYTYEWIDSTESHTWQIIPGATGKDYDPGILSDSTFFKRIVLSAGLRDTSFRISVYVHPAITGNTIAANDTVCSGNAPELFESAAAIGGGPDGGTFNYVWQHEPDGAGDFTDITSKTTEPTYQAGGLTTSTDYRRIAYAGVCIDTSDVERVLVLETLTGNDITPFDTICINTAPDLIDGPAPSNGDQGDLRYRWLTSTSPGNMGTEIPGETGISYQSPPLNQTTYFRRVVLSGNDDACKDTSAYVEVLNIPAITNNSITASQTVCQQDQPDLLGGSTPGGGYMGQYSYTWIASTDQSNWTPAGGGGPNDVRTGYDPGVMTGDTTWYQRVVGSGGLDLVCKDTSVFIVINVLPSITNNVITPADAVMCQRDMPEEISGTLPGGGATIEGNDPTQIFRWEVAQIEGVPGSGDWSHPSTGADLQHYTDPSQLSTDVDRWYKRIVISGSGGQCTDTSNLVRLVVHSEITANAIDNDQAICFEDTRALRHGNLTGGEDTIVPVYTWRSWMEGETSADAVDIPSSDQQEYMSGPYTDPGNLIYYYDRVVEIGACRDTSASMLVTVMQLPGGQLTDNDFIPQCEKDTFLYVDLNMGDLTPGHFVLPWEVYLENGVLAGIGPGSLDQDLDTMGIDLDTHGADHQSYSYAIESIRFEPEAGYYCISKPSLITGGPVVIDVSRRPDPQILADGAARDSFKVCNYTALLVLDPDNGFLTRWSDPAGSVSFSPGTGENEVNVSIPDSHNDYGEYRIWVRSEAGDCAGEDYIDLHFFEQPAPASARDTVLFLIDEVQMLAEPPTAGIGTWTRIEGEGELVDPNDPNTLVRYLGDGENTFLWTIRNGEGEGTCEESDTIIVVLKNKIHTYNGFSPNQDMSNEYYIMQGLIYADEFTVTFVNSLGSTVRTITQDNIAELEVDESLISEGLREDEMVVWDGKANNGNLVAPGTYYYVLEYVKNDIAYLFKDYVVVKE